jgi:SHS2 domain-containing protein
MYFHDPKKYSEIDHTADVGIYAQGDSYEEVFANAAFGMRHIIYGNINVAKKRTKTIKLCDSTLSELMVRWLNEINFLLGVRDFLISCFGDLTVQAKKDQFCIKAILHGDKASVYGALQKVEIKAVTYHQLKFEKTDLNYYTQIIFDI